VGNFPDNRPTEPGLTYGQVERDTPGMTTTSPPQVSLQLEEITPEMALDLLAGNSNNRNIRTSVVEAYARDMTAGVWRAGQGEPIHIAPDGEIGNGQHRLHAVLESETTVLLPILRAPLEWRMVADQGIKRTFADVLRINHQQVDQNKLVAAIRYLWEYRRAGVIGFSTNATIIDVDEKTTVIGKPTVAELETVYIAEPGVREHVITAGRLRANGVDIFPSLYITIDYLLHQADYDDAEGFTSAVIHGNDLDVNSPILALRRVMMGDSRPHRAKAQAALIIKAWNAYRAGDAVRNLSWRSGGTSPEPFPDIDGMPKNRRPPSRRARRKS